MKGEVVKTTSDKDERIKMFFTFLLFYLFTFLPFYFFTFLPFYLFTFFLDENVFHHKEQRKNAERRVKLLPITTKAIDGCV